jgi:hypothetical protein
MRRTSLLLGALLLGGRMVSAQTSVPTPSFRSPAMQPTNPPGTTTNPVASAPNASGAASVPPVELKENLTTFDGANAVVVWQDQSWKLVADGVVIKDFGRRESDGRQAQRLIHDLHLTQHGTVGEPTPLMEYWLSEGHTPVGFATGMRTLAIDTAGLKAEQTRGQWVVRDRQRIWLNFGQRGDEARQALLVMQKYGFTQVGVLGGPVPAMMVFLGNPVRPGSGAATFKPPTTAPTDPAAAAGYVSATLPSLRNATPPSQQSASAFGKSPVESLSATHPTTSPHGAPSPPFGLTDRVAFDWRQAQVRQEQGHWKVAAGSHVLADFGTNQHAAAEGLKAVQYYHFTEHCQVGQPSPSCSYFLVAGQAPRGIPFGLEGRAIDAAHLTVEQIGEKYTLVSGGRAVLQVGSRPEEARYMIDVIQRMRFDHVCHVGGPEEQGMTFLVQAR